MSESGGGVSDRRAPSWRRISWVPGRYAVCRLDARESPETSQSGADRGFLSVTRSANETSVVCDERDVPDGAKCEPGWSVLRLEGPIPFEVTGVLASLAAPLASAGVGIFAVSTYDTDYVLVKEGDRARARAALETAGFTFPPAS